MTTQFQYGSIPFMSNYPQIIKQILSYNKKRGWNPEAEDSAKSIVIEAAELLELFQWDASDRKDKSIHNKDLQAIKFEVADIYWYLITFCQKMGINIPQCVEEKLVILNEKYPEKEFQGKHNHAAYIKHKMEYRNKKS